MTKRARMCEHEVRGPRLTRGSVSDGGVVLGYDQRDGTGLSLAEQTPSARKVGALLGAVHSTLIAIRLAALVKEVHTFSLSNDDAGHNQSHIEELASHCGLRRLRQYGAPTTPQRAFEQHASERSLAEAAQPLFEAQRP